MKSITCLYRTAAVAVLAAGAIDSISAAPVVFWKSIPQNTHAGSVIYPIANVEKNGYDVTLVTLYYSWDGVSWSLLYSTSTPANPYSFTGAGCYMSQTGTFHLKAVATDASASSTTLQASLPVYASYNGQPSLLAAAASSGNALHRNGTYNYGAAWMLDGGTHRVWWTMMRSQTEAGDRIVHVAGTSLPGTSTPSTALDTSSWSNHLVSNPSVIKTTVSYGSGTYSYVMYFTEGDNSGGNGVAMAFSNDGSSWTTPVHIIDTDGQSGDSIGIPSVIRFSNKWAMFTNDRFAATDSGALIVGYRESSDGVSWPTSRSKTVTMAGITQQPSDQSPNGANVVFSYRGGYWYLAYTHGNASTTDGTAVRVYKKDASVDLETGSWSLVTEVNASTSFRMKHNAGFLTDTNGMLYGSNVTFSFSGNKHTNLTTDQGRDHDESQIYYVNYQP